MSPPQTRSMGSARRRHAAPDPLAGSSQRSLFYPLRVSDALGVIRAVALIHCLQRPSGLPERERDNPGTEPAIKEETEPRMPACSCALSLVTMSRKRMLRCATVGWPPFTHGSTPTSTPHRRTRNGSSPIPRGGKPQVRGRNQQAATSHGKNPHRPCRVNPTPDVTVCRTRHSRDRRISPNTSLSTTSAPPLYPRAYHSTLARYPSCSNVDGTLGR
jgi:hypothetical protein